MNAVSALLILSDKTYCVVNTISVKVNCGWILSKSFIVFTYFYQAGQICFHPFFKSSDLTVQLENPFYLHFLMVNLLHNFVFNTDLPTHRISNKTCYRSVTKHTAYSQCIRPLVYKIQILVDFLAVVKCCKSVKWCKILSS